MKENDYKTERGTITLIFVVVMSVIAIVAIGLICFITIKYKQIKDDYNALKEAVNNSVVYEEEVVEVEPEYYLKIVPKEDEELIVVYETEVKCDYAYFIGNMVRFKIKNYNIEYNVDTSRVTVLLRKIPNV